MFDAKVLHCQPEILSDRILSINFPGMGGKADEMTIAAVLSGAVEHVPEVCGE